MARMSTFPTGTKVQRQPTLLDATVRDFSGGWNVVDNDLNLNPKFSKVLQNMQRGIDGSNAIRPGTRLFADAAAFLDTIINCEYYNNHIVAVGSNGSVVKVDSTGTVVEIFNTAFASALAGAPAAWSTTAFASFAIFNGELIICNGVNKPLIVNASMTCSYLKDLADNSNVFVPIARFVVAHGRYLVMAGDLADGQEDVVYISATDTSGTWLGASAPNDAVNITLGSRVPSGSNVIKGLGRFRDKLMVLFENAILPGTLGGFVSTDHVPVFDDAIENVGGLSHRAIQTLGDDGMVFADFSGVSSIKRTLFTGGIISGTESDLIKPKFSSAIHKLSTTSTLEDRVWALWDENDTNLMIFVPNADSIVSTTETRCFVYKKNSGLKIEAWQDWRNWNFRSGCRSALKRIFLTKGSQIFILGEIHDDPIYRDFVDDQEMFTDSTSFADYTGWSPIAAKDGSGVPIPFIWEMPWSDHKERFLVKNSRYISFDTTGENRFTVQMFIDNIYNDRSYLGEGFLEDGTPFGDDFGWDVEKLDPALEMDFIGGDAPGFGLDPYGDNYGSGRVTRAEHLYAWIAKYKLQKLRILGDGISDLKFVSTTVAYSKGSPRR